MALNFPNSPTDGDNWIDPSNGTQYTYSSTTNSWSVVGISTGAGSVTSVNVSGSKGLVSSGGPVVDLGTINIRLDIDGPQALPILP